MKTRLYVMEKSKPYWESSGSLFEEVFFSISREHLRAEVSWFQGDVIRNWRPPSLFLELFSSSYSFRSSCHHLGVPHWGWSHLTEVEDNRSPLVCESPLHLQQKKKTHTQERISIEEILEFDTHVANFKWEAAVAKDDVGVAIVLLLVSPVI